MGDANAKRKRLLDEMEKKLKELAGDIKGAREKLDSIKPHIVKEDAFKLKTWKKIDGLLGECTGEHKGETSKKDDLKKAIADLEKLLGAMSP